MGFYHAVELGRHLRSCWSESVPLLQVQWFENMQFSNVKKDQVFNWAAGLKKGETEPVSTCTH